MDFNTEKNRGSSPEPNEGSRDASRDSVEFDFRDPVNSFAETVRTIALDPIGFFRGLSRSGDYVNPLVFSLICFEVFAIVGGLVGFIGALISPERGFLGAVVSFVLLVLLMPLIAAIVVFASAAVYHLVVYLLVKPSNSGFEATFRVLAYVSIVVIPLAAVTLVAWIPVAGFILNTIASIAATAYALYLAVIGVREVHETTTGRAVLVMVIPTAASFLIMLALVLMGVGAFFFLAR
jgi:hypothetical protein